MDKDFEKGIKDFSTIRLTDAEKSRMLDKIFATPIRSPFFYQLRISQAVLAVLVIFIAGGAYGSGNSLPGDIFYPIKVELVEPVMDVVNYAPEDKIVWEEEKVERRIVEAEKLAEKNQLDDKKLESLEKRVKKSSNAFAKAAQVVASSSSTSTKSQREKEETLRSAFKKKIAKEDTQNPDPTTSARVSNQTEEPEVEVMMMFSTQMMGDVATNASTSSTSSKATSTDKTMEEERENQREKIRRLRNWAIQALDRDEDEEDGDKDREED